MDIEYACSAVIKCKGFTELMIAFSVEKDLKKVKEILKKCSIEEINAKNNLGVTVLMLCSGSSNLDPSKKQEMLEILKELIESKCDLNLRDNEARTALMIASGLSNTTSNLETVKLLIEAKSDLNLKSKNGNTALMIACRYSNTTSNLETVNLLIESKCDLDIKNLNGNTALMIACKNTKKTSNLETVKLLTESKIDLNLQNKEGDTALMLFLLVENPKIEIIEYLLKNGSDVSTKNRSNEKCHSNCSR